MRKIIENERLVYKCCKLYYEEMMTQQKISDKLGISRVSVSKMLRLGKEQGIVRVQVVSPDTLTYNRLAQELEQLFSLKEVVVVENDPLATHYDEQNAMSAAAIKLLESYLHENDVVGVSMGRTLRNICLGKRETEEPLNCTFVPVIGGIQSGRSHSMHIHANRIAADFAQMYGGKYSEFFAPAIFSGRSVKEMFENEAPMKEINAYYEKMKTLIVGIGLPRRFTSTVVKAGYMTAEELNYMVEHGAVGDLSLQFYDKEGNTEPFRDFTSRVAGLAIEKMQHVDNRLCIAGGKLKAEAVLGAIRGGFINMMVIDQDCAQSLLELGKGEEK